VRPLRPPGPAHTNARESGEETGCSARAAQNKEGEGRREQTGVALAFRPPGHKGKEGKLFISFFFFYLYSFKTLFKMDFESESKEIKTTPQNKTNATS
jgi:hypothetical protein